MEEFQGPGGAQQYFSDINTRLRDIEEKLIVETTRDFDLLSTGMAEPQRGSALQENSSRWIPDRGRE